MTAPLVRPPQSLTNQNPEESPEIKEARQKSRDAGYERNRLEAAAKRIAEEKGKDSPEAKSAQEALGKAQQEVERLQGELRKLLHPKPEKKAQAPQKNPPKPQKVAQAPKAPKAPKAAPAPTPAPQVPPKAVVESESVRSVLIFEHSEKVYNLEKIIKNPKLDEALKKYLKDNGEIDLEKLRKELQRPRGEYMEMRSQVFLRKIPEIVKKIDPPPPSKTN